MIPTLSQVCSLNSPFEKDIEDYSAGGCRSIEAWFTKLEDYVQQHSVSAVRELLNANDCRMHVASFHGGLFTSDIAARDLAWDHFQKRLELCRQLEIRTIVLACDLLPPIGQADIDRARQILARAATIAGDSLVRLALEPQSRAAFGNNLQSAAAIVSDIGSPHLGVCFDLFQFYLGPSKFSDLRYLSEDNLFHVQLSDLADVPREFATDSDRILPGDGDFEIAKVVRHLTEIGYSSCVSLEVMNPQIWNVPARQFGEIGLRALQAVIGGEQSM